MKNPILETERLQLRLVERTDLNHIHEIHSFPEVDEFNTLGIPKDLDETKKVVEDTVAHHEKEIITNYCFAVLDKLSGDFFGMTAILIGSPKYKSAEIWYKFHPQSWGKGYATEACQAVLKFGFQEKKLHRIGAGCAIQNVPSIRVLEKLGMTREGHRRKSLPLKTGWTDNYDYAILETEFMQ